jgi:hypothetical protein
VPDLTYIFLAGLPGNNRFLGLEYIKPVKSHYILDIPEQDPGFGFVVNLLLCKEVISTPVKKKRIRSGNMTAMDTHKTDAELSFLSSGEEVHHPLPVRADDLCFISNTNHKYPMVRPGACFCYS